MAMSGGDGFTVVKRRGRSRHKQVNVAPLVVNREAYSGPDSRTLLEKIALCRKELRDTKFFNDTIHLMESLDPPHQYSEMVCYGIGRIGTCHIARCQFALFIELMDFCKPQTTLIYDPVLHQEEKAAISKCGCKILPRNDLCKHRVKERTLFYMPHCGKAMYNNLLWANWNQEQLTKIAIIGNSFGSYREKIPVKQLQEEALYVSNVSTISQIQKVCLEYPFPDHHPDSTIFNDTSLHTFPQENLHTLHHKIWENCPEPIMNHQNKEIISEKTITC